MFFEFSAYVVCTYMSFVCVYIYVCHMYVYSYIDIYKHACMYVGRLVYRSVCPRPCLSVCLSVRLSVCPSVGQSVCLSACLSVCLCSYVGLSACVCRSSVHCESLRVPIGPIAPFWDYLIELKNMNPKKELRWGLWVCGTKRGTGR